MLNTSQADAGQDGAGAPAAVALLPPQLLIVHGGLSGAILGGVVGRLGSPLPNHYD